MSYIKSVMPMDGYRLCVEMQTGSLVVVEMKNKLETARFGELSNEQLFRTATTDGEFIIWQTGRYSLKVSVKEILDVVMVDRQLEPE